MLVLCAKTARGKKKHTAATDNKAPKSQRLQPAFSSRAGQRPLKCREETSKWKLRNKFTAGKGQKQGHVAEEKGSYVPE